MNRNRSILVHSLQRGRFINLEIRWTCLVHFSISSKGLCHEMNNLFEGPKSQISTFLVPCYGENGNSSFCLLIWKHAQILKNWNPLQNSCCCSQEAACDSVNCSVSQRWWWKIQKLLKRVSVFIFKIIAVSFFKGEIEVSNSLWGAARFRNSALLIICEA
jgi:hypothetical protein